jgi:hypothetical protein
MDELPELQVIVGTMRSGTPLEMIPFPTACEWGEDV